MPRAAGDGSLFRPIRIPIEKRRQPMSSPGHPGSPDENGFDDTSGALLGVLRKLSLLSGTLGEIDDWLESRGPPDSMTAITGACRRSPITLENLDEHVAREGT